MPFGKALAPQMLHHHTSHAEAVARISWCISERALGVVTGEVGAGKTVAIRAALAGLEPSRHTTIYRQHQVRSAASLSSTFANCGPRTCQVPTSRSRCRLASTADWWSSSEARIMRTWPCGSAQSTGMTGS